MKKTLLLVALALALPTAMFAGSNVEFSNEGGTLSGSSSGLSLSGSALIAVDGLNGTGLITGNNLGSVSFTTGALVGTVGTTVGSVTTFAAGGMFTITGNGTNGIPNGVIFSGTFSSPVTLTLASSVSGNNTYDLAGTLAGSLGSYVTSGNTVSLVFSTGKGLFDGVTTVGSGDTGIVVPEPGSLSLLGTGLIGLAGLVRHKLKV